MNSLARLSLLVVLAACTAAPPVTTEPPSPTATIVPPSPTRSPTMPPTPSPTSTATSVPTESASAAIRVIMGDAAGRDAPLLFYVPERIEAPAGALLFELFNQTGVASQLHNMIIGTEIGGDALATSAAVQPNQTSLFAVDGLSAGTYQFWCTIDDHWELGMTGTLTITP